MYVLGVFHLSIESLVKGNTVRVPDKRFQNGSLQLGMMASACHPSTWKRRILAPREGHCTFEASLGNRVRTWLYNVLVITVLGAEAGGSLRLLDSKS